MTLFLGSLPLMASALAISGAAGLLRGVTGFGSALLMAPLLSRVFMPVEAVTITLMMGVAASLQLLPRYVGRLQVRLIVPVGVSGLALLVPGVFLLRIVDPDLMRHSLAIVMIVVASALWAFPRYRGPSGTPASIIAGALGGLIMGATSMGGPPVVLYLVSCRGTAEQKKANVIAVVGGLEAGALAVLALLGAVGLETVLRFATFLPLFLIGTWLGERLFRQRIGPEYQQVMLATLIVIGIGVLIL